MSPRVPLPPRAFAGEGPPCRGRLVPRHIGLPALLLLLSLPCTGCAILELGSGGHAEGTASLSQAAAAARDTTHESPALDVGVTTPPAEMEVEEAAPTLAPEPEPEPQPAPGSERAGESGVTPGAEVAGEPAAAASNPPEPPPTEHFLAGLVFGGGAMGGTGYDGFATVGLDFGGYVTPRLRVDGILSAGALVFTGESMQGKSFLNASELGLDVVVRYYLTGARTVLGIYPLAGIGTGTLYWDYAGPVPIVEDGEPRTVTDDRLNHFSIYGGAGMSLLQSRYVHLGANLVGGVRVYGWHTNNGLKNDMLPGTGFFRLLLDANFHWGHSSW